MKEIEPAHRRQTSRLQMHSYFPLEMLAPRHVKKEKAALFVAPSWDQQVVLWLIIASLSLASYGLISHFCITTVQVSGRSMLPALHDGERYNCMPKIIPGRIPTRLALTLSLCGCFILNTVLILNY